MTILNSVNNQALQTTSSPVFAQTTLSALNPGITYTGAWTNPIEFTMYKSALFQNGSFTNNILSASYDGNSASEPSLLTLNLGSIQQITTNLALTFTSLTSLVASSLISVPVGFSFTAPLLTTLTMTNLLYIGSFSFIAATLATCNFPALIAIAGTFNPILALCTTAGFSSLTTIIGATTFSAASLVTLNFSALVNSIATSPFTITAASLVNFSFGSGLLLMGGNVIITGAALNVASVDSILASLAALDGTSGTTAWSNKTVNLSGGTSATPDTAGLASKAILVARGCTVTTN